MSLFDSIIKGHATAHRTDALPDGRRKGFKRAKKELLKVMRKQQAMGGALRLDPNLWLMDTYDPNCKRHCDHGIDGYQIVGKDIATGNPNRVPVVCVCVKPKEVKKEEPGSGIVEEVKEPTV